MLLNISGLQVSIDNRQLLSDINFSVMAGEHLCITGPNGAGKSTLLMTGRITNADDTLQNAVQPAVINQQSVDAQLL